MFESLWTYSVIILNSVVYVIWDAFGMVSLRMRKPMDEWYSSFLMDDVFASLRRIKSNRTFHSVRASIVVYNTQNQMMSHNLRRGLVSNV
jgi:hypothetical protein